MKNKLIIFSFLFANISYSMENSQNTSDYIRLDNCGLWHRYFYGCSDFGGTINKFITTHKDITKEDKEFICEYLGLALIGKKNKFIGIKSISEKIEKLDIEIEKRKKEKEYEKFNEAITDLLWLLAFLYPNDSKFNDLCRTIIVNYSGNDHFDIDAFAIGNNKDSVENNELCKDFCLIL